MKIKKFLFTLILIIFFLLPFDSVIAGAPTPLKETDSNTVQLYSFFDLRERETFIQITNIDSTTNQSLHIQIFDVSNDCNENNFFDDFTPNDTHIYNIRDIITNDGSPSGVVLPNNSYGIVGITIVGGFSSAVPNSIVGNVRVLDNSGYEYRTNIQGNTSNSNFPQADIYTFNFNVVGGVTLSDVIGFVVSGVGDQGDIMAADIVNANVAFDVDILNNNEVVFSCRNVIFACVDQDNPRLEELLESVGEASVASFEYGINNAIPHSKGGELLCPGNTITEGIARLNVLQLNGLDESFVGYIGLNNGNGRGSLDSFWLQSFVASFPGDDDDG